MIKKKKKNTGGDDATQETESKVSIEEHLQEPMFLIAIAGFLVTALMLYSSNGFIVDNSPIILGVLLLLSVYFLNIHLKNKTKNKKLYGIPVLLTISTWFSILLVSNADLGLTRDYLIFTFISGLFLFFYALHSHNIIDLKTALILAIFVSTIFTHLIPAFDIYLAEIDPHWYYKWAQQVSVDGHTPDYDYLTYPLKGGITYYGSDIPDNPRFGLEEYYNETSNTYPAGLDISRHRLFASFFMGAMHTALSPFGFSIEDAAMLYPLVIGAFTIIIFYLLLKYLFAEMKPYNEAIGVLGAFMLFLAPAFSTKASAGNCEDDIFGMFLLVASFMLLAAAYQKKSLIYSIASGISFLALSVTWGGYDYAIIVLALAMSLHAVTSYLKNDYCMRMVPYALLMYLISKLHVLFLHRHGLRIDLPLFDTSMMTMLFVGAIGLSIILEFLRFRKNGPIKVKDEGFFDSIDNFIEKNITTIAILIIAGGVIVVVLIGPMSVIDPVYNVVFGVKVGGVVGKTIAEQNPLASNFSDFLSQGYQRYGLALIYGLCMIPVLAYVAFDKNSFGAAFILSWSLPMMWGVFNKSQYLFTSSTAVVALGATIGLYAVVKKEDLNSLKIISAVMILMVPLLYMPFLAGDLYPQFVGVRTLYATMTDEMYMWRPALDWLSDNTRPNEAVVTWWDYGHWITSISHRPVLIDNLQADHYEIQDVARFFMLNRDQEESMDTIRAYNDRYNEIGMNLTHVVIDWTMVGKGSAMHFIATGVIENETEGSGMNFLTCQFLSQQSSQPKMTTDKDGKPALARQLIFACPGPIAGLSFEIIGEEINSVDAILIDSSGNPYFIPWSTWAQDHPRDSILGVQPLYEVLSLAMQRPDILGNMNARWGDANGVLRSAGTYQLIYVMEDFNDYMMARLYLGDHVDSLPTEECLLEENKNKYQCASYMNQGLFTGNLSEFKPKYFKLKEDSNGGYVRIYEIDYNIDD